MVMNFQNIFEAVEKESIKAHLKSRGMDLSRTALVYDEETKTANFFLYNLSGKLIGYQKYNPAGTKNPKSDTPKELWKYFTYATKEGTGSSIAVYGLETYDIKDKYLWITEGIFDVNKIHNAGEPGIAVLANNPSPSLKSWLNTLPQKKIVVCDNDEAGQKLKSVGDYFISAPMPYKDLGEMPQHKVDELVRTFKLTL
jgi:hypothetical protein